METGSTEYERYRLGFAVLGLGLFVLLSAWVIAVNRSPINASSRIEAISTTGVHAKKLDPPDPNRMLPAIGTGMLIWGLVIIFIFVISALAFLRMSRNYRRMLLKRPTEPTSTADVWRMHKTPPAASGSGDDVDGDKTV